PADEHGGHQRGRRPDAAPPQRAAQAAHTSSRNHAVARASAYSFQRLPECALIQEIVISGRSTWRRYASLTSSRLAIGPPLRRQPRASQPAAHSLSVRTARFESLYSVTAVPGGTRSNPWMIAVSSISLLVVAAL